MENRLLVCCGCLLLACCSGVRESSILQPELKDVSRAATGSFFSLQQAGEEVQAVYADRETLSLKMVGFASGGVEEVSSLDRISFSTDLDASFGSHLYLLAENRQHIFYLDRIAEEKQTIKWISKSLSEKAWHIDLVPFSGRIVAALSAYRSPARIDLFLAQQGKLLLVNPQGPGPPALVAQGFDPRGDVSLLQGGKTPAFTSFDGISRRLYLIRQVENSYQLKPLYPAGEVHHAAITERDGLQVLIYDPQGSELVLLELEGDLPGLRRTPVTLCHDVTSVFRFGGERNGCFLFSEGVMGANRRKSYRISLLYPLRGRYRKTSLYVSPEPILKFKALYREGTLYVLFLQESLKMLTVRTPEPALVENQDL